MIQFLRLAAYDFRQIFRDAMLRVFLFTPLFLWLIAYFAVPAIWSAYPILAPYKVYVLMGLAMQTAVLMGFVGAFMLLDEKDEGVLEVLRTLPMSPRFFVGYRLLLGWLLAYLSALWLLWSCSDGRIGGAEVWLLALPFSLTAPFILLSVVALSGNKIEGMALFKGLDLLLMLPLAAFFMPENWGYAFALLPMYGGFCALQGAYEGGEWLYSCLAGLLTTSIYLAYFYRRFSFKVFRVA